jgi:ATP-binding cassette subfamily B protein
MLIKFIISYYKKAPLKMLFGFLMLVAVDIAQLIAPRIVQRAIDYIIATYTTSGNNYSYLGKFTLLIFALAIAIGIFRFFWRMIIIGMSHYIEMDFKNRLFKHLLLLSNSFFTRTKIGDIMAHMTNDMTAVRRTCAFGVIAGFDAIFLFLATLVFMLTLNAKLTLYAMIPLPIISLVSLFFIKVLFRKFKSVQESFSLLTEKVREMISGIKIIQAFQQEEPESKNFDKLSQEYLGKNISLIKIWGTMFPLIFLFAEIGMAIILWVGGQQVILNELTTGELVAFFSYMGIIVWPMMAVGMVTNVYQRGNASYKRILELLEEKPDIYDAPRAEYHPLEGSIKLENIYFSYGEQIVLDNINIDIEKGQYIGICGRIGSGKSIIARLILRIIEPRKGRIFYDSIDYKKIKIAAVRDSIGHVPQDSFLFSDTIEGNVRFAKPDATLEEITEACRVASIHKNIMELKDQYKTLVGEKGVTLSGGQKQRLCIARAIIRRPQILILDDALSSVDTNTEKEIIRNLGSYSKGTKGITTIVISHRISSFIKADNIFVLDKGRIESSGTHRELIKKSEIYKGIYKIQKLEE